MHFWFTTLISSPWCLLPVKIVFKGKNGHNAWTSTTSHFEIRLLFCFLTPNGIEFWDSVLVALFHIKQMQIKMKIKFGSSNIHWLHLQTSISHQNKLNDWIGKYQIVIDFTDFKQIIQYLCTGKFCSHTYYDFRTLNDSTASTLGIWQWIILTTFTFTT